MSEVPVYGLTGMSPNFKIEAAFGEGGIILGVYGSVCPYAIALINKTMNNTIWLKAFLWVISMVYKG
jgi:hypothetical protein